MKVLCIKKNLQKAAILSEKIAGRNPALPVLNSVLIFTKNKDLNFLSTNLEMAIEISVSSKIKKEGKVAIPAKLFSSFVSSLTEDNINMDADGDNLIITTKNSTTTIKGYPVDDFPILPKINQTKTFTIDVYDFVSGLKSVYYAASLSEMKPELSSVFINSTKNTSLVFVATDTFRLAERTFPYKFSDSLNILIPYRSVVEIIRIFENQEGDLNITIDENNIVLKSNNLKFTSRLTEGNFPDYKKIIPISFTNTVTIDKKLYSDVLKSAGMFCGKLNEIKLRIYKEENFIELQTNNPDLGEHTVTALSDTEGDELITMFNYRYLIDCLPFVNSEKIILKFAGEGRPLLITGLNDSSFRYLIMPMKDL